MPTLRFHKLFASLFVFASLCVGAQAETYWWTGGTTGNWSDPTNWSTGPDIANLTPQAAGDPVPGDDPADIVNLISAATITVSSDVQIDQLLIPNPNLENSDFTITLTGSGSINATTKIDPVRAAGPSAGSTAKSTFVFDCDVSSAELIMHSGGDVTIAEGTKATISTISNPGGASPSTMLTVNGTLISNSISLSDTTTRQMTVGPNAIVTAGTLTGSNASVTNNGLIVSNGDISSVIKEESTGSTAETGGATGFVWTGATNSNWSTASNWLNGTAPSSASDNISIPNVATKPLIASGDTVDITASKLTIVNGADITVNGTLNLTGDLDLASIINTTSSGTLSVSGELSNSANFSAPGLELTCGTLAATHNLSCEGLSVSGAAAFTSDSNLTLTTSGSSTLSFGGAFSQSGSGNLSVTSGGAVTFADSVTTGNLNITASGNINFTGTVQTDNLTINAAPHNLTFGNTASVKDITFDTTTSTDKNMTVTGNWTNNGSFTASDGTVTFTTASTDASVAEIHGVNTFANIEIQRNLNIYDNLTVTNNFTANKKVPDDGKLMGGRNILFASGKTLNVGGLFDLQGKAQTGGNRLRIAGLNPDSATTPWTLNWTGSGSNTIKFVSIKGCTNSGNTILTEKSTDFGGNSGFIFPDQEYTWQGTVSNAWSNINNWDPKSNPSKGSKIIIDPSTNHPILTSTDDTNFNTSYGGTDYNGTITVSEDAIFDIADQSLTLGKITNNGTVRLNGASGQTITGTIINGSDSTVEYFDSTGTATFNSFVWDGDTSTDGKQYENLKISMPITSTEQLDVAGKTTIAAGAGNTVSLTSTANKFTDVIKLGDTSVANAGIVTIDSSTAITLDADANATSLTAKCPAKIKNLTVSNNVSFEKAVTLLGAAEITAASGDNIHFEDTVSCESGTSFSLSTKTSNVQFDKAITNLTTLTTEATATFAADASVDIRALSAVNANINCSEVKTSSSQSYSGTVSIGADTTLESTTNGDITFSSTLENAANTLNLSVPDDKSINFVGAVGNSTAFNSLKISQAGSTTFTQAPYITTFIDTAASGNIIFNNGGNIITTSAQNFTTNGTVTINGTTPLSIEAAGVSFSENTSLAGSGTLKITAGSDNITFNKDVGSSGTAFNKVEIVSSGNTLFKEKAFLATISDYTASGSITFKKGGSISSATTLNTSSTVTIGATSTDSSADATLEINGNFEHNTGPSVIYGWLKAADITLSGLSGGGITIENSGTLSLNATSPASTVTCISFTQSGTGSVNLGRDISADSGAIQFTRPVTLTGDATLTASGTLDAITFGNAATINGNYKLTLVSNTGNISLGAAIGSNASPIAEIELQGTDTSKSATFNKDVYAGTFTDTSYSGNIEFKEAGRINSNTTFATPGKLTLSSMDFGTSPGTADFKHITGETVINGTIKAKDIELAKLTGGAITLTNSGTLTLNASDLLTCTSFTQDGSGSFTLGRNITASNDNISIKSTLTLNQDVTLTASATDKSITLNSSVAGGSNTLSATATNTYITATADNSITANGFTVSNNLTISNTGGRTTLAAPMTISGSAELTNGILDFNENSTVSGNLTLTEGNITVANNKTLSVNGNVTNNSSGSGTISGNGALVFTGNAEQTFTTSGRVYSNVIENKDTSTGKLTINGNCTISNFQIQNGKETVFSDTPIIDSLSDAVTAGSITFNNGATLNTSDASGGQTFNTNNKVTLKGTMNFGSSTPHLAFTHTADETEIDGTINAGNMILAASSINGVVNGAAITCGYGSPAKTTNISTASLNGTAIIFSGSVTGSSLTINQSTSTNFNGVVTLTSFTDTSNSGDISFNAGGSITAAGGQVFNTPGKVSFNGTTSFGTTSPEAYVTLSHINGDTYITGILNTGNISLAKTFASNATVNSPNAMLSSDLNYINPLPSPAPGPVTFTGNVLIHGTSNAVLGGGTSNISVDGNIIISKSGSPAPSVTLNDALTVSNNLVMFKGAVTANADISVTKDIVLLGTNYSLTDSTTGITDEYAYNGTRPENWSTSNYSLTAAMPDGTTAPATADYSATLEVADGKKITAVKNFYANGTNLTASGGTGLWLLSLPDLTSPANGFAEAYHSVVSNCKVICTADNSDDGTKARLITLDSNDNSTNSNVNVDFDEFKITSAYTIRDNAVRVEFNRPVRYHPGTISTLKFHNNAGTVSSSTNFTGFYSDPDCISPINLASAFPSYTNTNDGNIYYYCYVKANPQDSAIKGAWNTDATGKSAGASDEKSSDRDGIHHSSLPCLDFPRALQGAGSTASTPFILTDIWGKRLNNYSQRVTSGSSAEPAFGSSSSTHEVEDKTGPVLWTVRTGQELHNAYDAATGETSQHSYDSHNFLEFRYSEKVDIDTLTAASVPLENIQVTDSLGAISEGIISSSPTLTIAGLAKISAPAGENLQLYTGSSGTANKYVNALYRPDEYSVRLSVAGWTDGTVSDYAGNEFKKWTGYIESATQFTGSTARAVVTTNTHVKDLEGNSQTEYTEGNRTEPTVLSDISGSHSSTLLPSSPNLYGEWDISQPVFTPLRFSHETSWGDKNMSEAIGNTNGSGSTLDRIDFHFFDNTPSFTSSDEAEWYTEIGWCTPGSEASKDNLKDSDYTYCADIIGGARQFDTDASRRTSGGIRFSTKAEISTAFRYSSSPSNPSPENNFLPGIANVHTTVISQLFTGSSAPMRPANDPDGLYLGLGLSDTNLSVETTFSFSYSESLGYLTDLAGNRLRNTVSKTIDRTPPSFDVIFSPLDTKSVYIIFVKKLVTDSAKLKLRDNSGINIQINENFASLLPKCFRIISIDENGESHESTENQIDTSVAAELIEKNTNNSFTCFKLTTTNEININNIKNLYVQLIMPSDYPERTTDPFTSNINSRVTLIQDELGNYMSMYCAHALSDFAINYINPLYAYSSDMIDAGVPVMNGLYDESSWAVHDWNSNQQKYGTLPAGHPISIVADSKGEDMVRIYLSSTPDADSVSKQFNSDFKAKLRVWLPSLADGLFRSLSATNNSNFVYTDGSALGDGSQNKIFNLTKDTVSAWKSGDQISFMFGLMKDSNTPIRIYNTPYYDVATERFDLSQTIPVPLYSLRMTDTADINTLDLWSFRLRSITSQRGGVTILNNVINAEKGEKTVIQIDLPEDGKLNVIVMTLDGNIISYLNRGNTKAGQHYFTWNGKNKNGNPVARGMYFVRVTGSGIDETRKVMVVK